MNMKRFPYAVICLSVLSACVSLPQEKIVSDTENITKLSELNQNMEKQITNHKDYIKCASDTERLNEIVKKSKITADDYKFVSDMFDDNGVQDIKQIDCSNNISTGYSTSKSKFKEYCKEKYWNENILVSTALFPVRLTNATLAIGTLGIWCGTSMCHSQYSSSGRVKGIKDPENPKISAGFNLWAPGDDWNMDVCVNMFPSQKDLLKEQNLSSFTQVDTLKTKTNEYLEAEQIKKEAVIKKAATERKAEIQKQQAIEIAKQKQLFEECMRNPTCKQQYIQQQERARAQVSCGDVLVKCSMQCAMDYAGVDHMAQSCRDECRLKFNKCQQQ